MYKIVIIMFLLDPSADDALEINFKNNKLLEFSKIEHCYEHIHNNLEELKAFAYLNFSSDIPTKSINCFKKLTGV